MRTRRNPQAERVVASIKRSGLEGGDMLVQAVAITDTCDSVIDVVTSFSLRLVEVLRR